MKITFWGVRGSYPVAGVTTNDFGGNTSCVEVRLGDGTLLILDAGTGIRSLGQSLMQNGFSKGHGHAHLLLSHPHWDHIQGFPFFEPAYIPGNQLTIYARKQNQVRLREILAYQSSADYFTVPFSELKAGMDFKEIEADQTFTIGSATVRTVRLNHPNIALGYRIDADGKSFAYITDTAPFEDILIGEAFIPKVPDKVSEEDRRELTSLQHKLLSLIEGADFMVYDTFFRMEDYKRCPHWGHSTPEHGIRLCQEAGVKVLALFHHAPSNTDAMMSDLEKQFSAVDRQVEVVAAAEGKSYEL